MWHFSTLADSIDCTNLATAPMPITPKVMLVCQGIVGFSEKNLKIRKIHSIVNIQVLSVSAIRTVTVNAIKIERWASFGEFSGEFFHNVVKIGSR